MFESVYLQVPEISPTVSVQLSSDMTGKPSNVVSLGRVGGLIGSPKKESTGPLGASRNKR